MNEADKSFLDDYELRVCRDLLRLAQEKQAAEEVMDAPDLQAKWEDIAAPYCVEAIKDFQDYPTVSLGWMMYVGMAMAHYWDKEWRAFCLGHPDPFTFLRDMRGWDCMDEAIREDVLGLKGVAFDTCEELVRSSAQLAYTLLRHEDVEPQTPMAYHVFIRTLRALYRLGISVELKRLGYKVERGK